MHRVRLLGPRPRGSSTWPKPHSGNPLYRNPESSVCGYLDPVIGFRNHVFDFADNQGRNPEGPGTLLLRNQSLKTMIVMAFGAQVLDNLVSGPSGEFAFPQGLQRNKGNAARDVAGST